MWSKNFKNGTPSCADARAIDMVEYLAGIGFQPAKIRAHNYWFHSPLRNESTPSFKVNRKINCWFDFGLGKGGSLIDFAILFHNCTISEFLQSLGGHLSFHRHEYIAVAQPEAEAEVHIIGHKPIRSYGLTRYLVQRKINIEIARQYCKETTFRIKEKEYYAVGFLNDSGGCELRNAFFKCSSSPKDITTIQKGASAIAVFEGFFDFLTYASILTLTEPIPSDFLILNSTSFLEKAIPVMEQYKDVRLFLDRDTTGQKCSHVLLSLGKQYHDESALYKNHKDLNDWAMHIGKNKLP